MEGYWKAYVELNGKTMEDARSAFEEMASECESVVWYYHPYGKTKGPHFHALVKNANCSDETYRNRLKKKFGVKGSQLGVSNNYERGTPMSEDTIDKYVRYMTKGEYEPFFNKGYEESYLKARKAEWTSKVSVGEIIVVKSSTRVTRWQIAREANCKYLELYPEHAEDHVVDMRKLISIVKEICVSNKKGRDYNNIASICQDCLADLSPSYWTAKILSRL